MNFRVRDICREKGINMEKLANILGISPNTLTRNINGNPTIETLEKIANALNVPIADLFERSTDNTITCPNCGKRFKMEE